VDKTEMDITEPGWGGMDWPDLAQDRSQWRDIFERGNGPPGSIGKYCSSCTTGGLSRRVQLQKVSTVQYIHGAILGRLTKRELEKMEGGKTDET
jgi:hypothetical protein